MIFVYLQRTVHYIIYWLFCRIYIVFYAKYPIEDKNSIKSEERWFGVHTMKKLYRSRAVKLIPVAVIALLLVVGAVAFTSQLNSAHAQHATVKRRSVVGGCSSVDTISNGTVNAALAQCGTNGDYFKATVVDSNMTPPDPGSTINTSGNTSIKAWLQNNPGVAYANQCNYFACSTSLFSARVGDIVCYQASGGSIRTDVECYTVASKSNTTPVLKLK